MSDAEARRLARLADYEILDTFETGIVLQGSEVKSLRLGHLQMADAYARVLNGGVWLDGIHIPPYLFAHGVGAHDPEDPQHQIGDPPTDLSLHPHSHGYRLILNNVLFPAAKKKELKT